MGFDVGGEDVGQGVLAVDVRPVQFGFGLGLGSALQEKLDCCKIVVDGFCKIADNSTVTRHSLKDKRKITQGRAAVGLGVTREHLNRVLNGHRQSRRLMAAWHQLKGER